METDNYLADVQSQHACAAAPARKKQGLRVELRVVGETVIVACRGRVVYREEAAGLTGQVSELLSDYSQVILNFAGVESVDSGGLGSLAMLCLFAKATGSRVSLCSVPPQVEKLLRLTNLSTVLEIHPTEAAALSACEAVLV